MNHFEPRQGAPRLVLFSFCVSLVVTSLVTPPQPKSQNLLEFIQFFGPKALCLTLNPPPPPPPPLVRSAILWIVLDTSLLLLCKSLIAPPFKKLNFHYLIISLHLTSTYPKSTISLHKEYLPSFILGLHSRRCGGRSNQQELSNSRTFWSDSMVCFDQFYPAY